MPDGAVFSLWKKSVFIKHAVNSLSLSPLGHSDSFASCKAWCVLISASLPKTPFPRKGAILLGLPPQVQARMLAVSHTKSLHDAVVQMADDLYGGLRPSTPFFNNEKVFLQTVNLCFLSQYHLSMRRYGAITAPLRNPLPRRTFLPVRKTNPLRFRLPYNLH